MPSLEKPSFDGGPMWLEWGISVLNGMMGDYLQDRRNGLAIGMACYHRNRPLALTPESLHQAHPHPTAKLCILLHGLGCNEGVWTFREPAQRVQGISYGSLLQQELGYTPFYVRYNTGLPVAENGKSLALLLNALVAGYPLGVAEIVLIGHSMGGLVLRSACHYGARRQYDWIQKIKHVFYLGTPHEGADLEKLGHLATAVLQGVPNPITRLIGGILNRRSQGIKDLRLGNLLDEELAQACPEAVGHGWTVPWLAEARHYLMVGTLTTDAEHPIAVLFGDALVRPLRVRHDAQAGSAPVPNHPITFFPQVHHLGLARSPEVYRRIKLWCAGESVGDD